MPRLKNKDFTVEELERMIDVINNYPFSSNKDALHDELVEMVKGTTLGEVPQEPVTIIWNFNFKLGIVPESFEQATTIKNAMRSKEVLDNIESRFKQMVYEELNWYNDRIKTFMIKGDSNVME